MNEKDYWFEMYRQEAQKRQDLEFELARIRSSGQLKSFKEGLRKVAKKAQRLNINSQS